MREAGRGGVEEYTEYCLRPTKETASVHCHVLNHSEFTILNSGLWLQQRKALVYFASSQELAGNSEMLG